MRAQAPASSNYFHESASFWRLLLGIGAEKEYRTGKLDFSRANHRFAPADFKARISSFSSVLEWLSSWQGA
jgi:hypothetical protein